MSVAGNNGSSGGDTSVQPTPAPTTSGAASSADAGTGGLDGGM